MNYYGFGIYSIHKAQNGIELVPFNKNYGPFMIFLGYWKFEIKSIVLPSWLKPVLLGVAGVILGYSLFFNFLTYHEVGLAKNFITKNVWIQNTPGFHFTSPLVLVVRIDTRPVRVGVHSSTRSTSSKLVQFVPEHWEEFVKNEGWRYYWWSNRISFNCSYPEEYRGWRDIARGYAYSAKQHPFFKVIEEYGEAE